MYYFNFAANTGYFGENYYVLKHAPEVDTFFGENYYVLIHAPEVDTLYSILVSSHPHTN